MPTTRGVQKAAGTKTAVKKTTVKTAAGKKAVGSKATGKEASDVVQGVASSSTRGGKCRPGSSQAGQGGASGSYEMQFPLCLLGHVSIHKHGSRDSESLLLTEYRMPGSEDGCMPTYFRDPTAPRSQCDAFDVHAYVQKEEPMMQSQQKLDGVFNENDVKFANCVMLCFAHWLQGKVVYRGMGDVLSQARNAPGEGAFVVLVSSEVSKVCTARVLGCDDVAYHAKPRHICSDVAVRFELIIPQRVTIFPVKLCDAVCKRDAQKDTCSSTLFLLRRPEVYHGFCHLAIPPGALLDGSCVERGNITRCTRPQQAGIVSALKEFFAA